MYPILGHHHTSMITKDAYKNNYFYQTVLGLRRVKVTVNQDDPSIYHIFYGDRVGNPGTELTFFELALAGQTYRGTNAITRIGLIVPSVDSLIFWQNRFKNFAVKHEEITSYSGRPALPFEDNDGLRLVLIAVENIDKDQLNWEQWEQSTIPKEHQIRGMGPVEMAVRRLGKLTRTLTDLLGYTEVMRTDEEVVFQSLEGEVTGEIVAKALDGPTERPGRGSIHHLAISVGNETELKYWDEKIKERGFQSTGIIDRFYFKSLYFRESNGIMFELATNQPGFMVDEDVDSLGERLALPPFLEDRRDEIKAKLEPLKGVK